jgi:hypothetical protein
LRIELSIGLKKGFAMCATSRQAYQSRAPASLDPGRGRIARAFEIKGDRL